MSRNLPLHIVSQLRAIAEQADAERVSVLVDEFAAEFPAVYEFMQDLVDLSPDLAASAAIERWPMLGIIRLYPDHERVIELLQAEIKARRQSNA